MTNLLGQLKLWRRTEQLIRLAWGGARWVAVVGAVLACACLVDWLCDRYLGSESFRAFRNDTWVFAPREAATEDWSPDAIMDETPFWLRLMMTLGQVALAGGLAYLLLVRPWRRTPPIDDLAARAERAIPQFDHRLVTAVQLNRPEARTKGMSQALIAEVTREAGELAAHHNLLKLVDYRRLPWGLVVALPILLAWAVFAALNFELATVLLKRQMLIGAEIPRTVHLTNVSKEVWPTGSKTEIRYLVTGEYHRDAVGRVRIEPDGQPEFYVDLKFKENTPEGAIFSADLPESTSDYSFSARLGNGRSRDRGRIRFEAPPQVTELESWQVLPKFLGTRDGTPNGPAYERQTEGAKRGEVIDALPMSSVRIGAVFSKPVKSATLVRIERGVPEKDFLKVNPVATGDDRTLAEWRFPITAQTVAYEIKLVDDRDFTNAAAVRRNVRMLDDKPPVVTFLPESMRHPDPATYWGKATTDEDRRRRFEQAKVATEWGDKLPLPDGGRMMVIYHAQSQQGISRANLRYRVLPRGVDKTAYPKEVQAVQGPQDDPEAKVYTRLPLKPVAADLDVVGRYVPELGLFERSWQGLSKVEQFRVNVEFYSFPSPDPGNVPPGLEAGGRYMFEIDGLQKTLPDGTTAKLEVGDTVELYVEAFDKNPAPNRPPGFTREGRRKIVVTADEAYTITKMRDEQNKRLQNKIADLVKDQASVFRAEAEPKKK